MKTLSVLLALGLFMSACLAITSQEKEQLLSLHQDVRTKLQNCQIANHPPARPMPKLQWHDGLAAKAQQWSDQCTMGPMPSHQRRTAPFTNKVGQNFGGGSSITQIFNSWLTQSSNYNPRTRKCRNSCVFWTTLIFENTTHIGCGITQCQGRGVLPFPISLVCNYGPNALEEDQAGETTTLLMKLRGNVDILVAIVDISHRRQ